MKLQGDKVSSQSMHQSRKAGSNSSREKCLCASTCGDADDESMRQRKGSAYLHLLLLYEQRRREICLLVWIKSIGSVALAHHLPRKHQTSMVAGHLGLIACEQQPEC